MHRFWVIPCAAAVLLASGCLVSSAAHAPNTVEHKAQLVHPTSPSIRYARFEVRGDYAASGSEQHVYGDFKRAHFVLVCDSSEKLSQTSWQSHLCKAILDYQTAPSQNFTCACPLDTVEVSIRGEINDRRIDERFSYCMCGYGKRAARDARVVLGTHPPFQSTNGGA